MLGSLRPYLPLFIAFSALLLVTTLSGIIAVSTYQYAVLEACQPVTPMPQLCYRLGTEIVAEFCYKLSTNATACTPPCPSSNCRRVCTSLPALNEVTRCRMTSNGLRFVDATPYTATLAALVVIACGLVAILVGLIHIQQREPEPDRT